LNLATSSRSDTLSYLAVEYGYEIGVTMATLRGTDEATATLQRSFDTPIASASAGFKSSSALPSPVMPSAQIVSTVVRGSAG
jgi:hypothetical protein